jgi:flagellar motility protein MotE (MotC chaperone)
MMKRNTCITALLLLCNAAVTQAETAAHASKPVAAPEDTDFCRAFASQAREARFARQKEQLNLLKSDIEAQLGQLNTKTEELQRWIEKREKIKASVSENLVKLYANIEAETAAAQLQKLDVEMVSSLLQQLNPKTAGEIMSAMEPAFASRLTHVMLVTSRNTNKDKQAQ